MVKSKTKEEISDKVFVGENRCKISNGKRLKYTYNKSSWDSKLPATNGIQNAISYGSEKVKKH